MACLPPAPVRDRGISLANRSAVQGGTKCKWRRPIGKVFALGALLLQGLAAQTVQGAPQQSELEAAFLFHFTQFVEWPPEAFSSTNSPIIIGVLGDNLLSATLEGLIGDEKVHGRPLIAQRCNRPDDVDNCHIVFVGRGRADQLNRILRRVDGRAVLTVSDASGFASQGGMIEFVRDDKRIKLRIHSGRARTAGLILSSKLLRVAQLVDK